ncbi:MAG TPA: rhodanese-like domain-containing protein [Roseiflexaceae bacterium]|nr:rhodanese-like domain-containing protein [Roseiflexaceae bacterium]
MAKYQNLTPAQVKEKLDRGDSFRLIDVREPHEYAYARIDGSELMPLSRAQEWVGDLTDDQEVVLLCHHGSRSAQVAGYLASQRGLKQVANMLGGIDEWSRLIDTAVPRY